MADAPLPKIHRNFFTYITISWLNPLLRRGLRKPLEQSDLPELSDSDRSALSDNVLSDFWSRVGLYLAHPQSHKRPGFFSSAFAPIAHLYFIHLFLLTVNVVADISLPLLTNQILRAIGGNYKGAISDNIYVLAGLFFGTQLMGSIAVHTSLSINVTLAIRLNAIITGAIYAKSLRLSPRARKVFTAGYINTIISNDVECINTICFNVNFVITSVMLMALALYHLWLFFGTTTFISISIYFLLFGFQFLAFSLMIKGVNEYQSLIDERIKNLREFLYGIKIVKFQAAETVLGNTIRSIRVKQLAALRQLVYPMLVIFFSLVVQQNGTPLIMFLVHGMYSNDFTPSKVFAGIGLIAALVAPSGMLGSTLSGVAQFTVSYTRINDILVAEEVLLEDATNRFPAATMDGTTSIRLDNANFVWVETKEEDTRKEKGKSKKQPKMWLLRSKRQRSETKSVPKTVIDVEHANIKKSGVVDPFETMVDADTESQKRLLDGNAGPGASDIRIFGLENITLSIPRGSLVAIVGPVGSGKSSLLEALIGSMRKTSGISTVCGTVSYCTQEPWILSGTVEENIVFGDESARARIPAAIEAACLNEDLAMMPAGLGTQIGEKGIMLSGGQRARLALARALARDTDVVILDDPLSALDAHVGRRVFENAICGALKGKTVILATHQLHVLPKTDLVVVMENGRIAEMGSFRDLMAKPDGTLVDIMRDYHIDDDDVNDDDKGSAELSQYTEKPVMQQESALGLDSGRIRKTDIIQVDAINVYASRKQEKMQEEDRRTGRIASSAIMRYFGSKNLFFTILCVLLLFVNLCTHVMVNITMSSWTADAWGWKSNTMYIRFFAMINLLDLFVRFLNLAILFIITYRASIEFHDRALTSLIHAPMDFFDTSPIGNILNRMTIDVMILDRNIFIVLSKFASKAVGLLSMLICMLYVTPIMVVIVLVIFMLSMVVFRVFQVSYRELRRLASIMTSPLISHVSETLNGIPTIKAYLAQHHFVRLQQRKLDLANQAALLLCSAQYWLSIRLQVLSMMVTLVIVVLAATGKLNASVAGLGLFASMQVGRLMSATLSMYGFAEAEFNSVERLYHYAYNLPSEAEHLLSTDPDEGTWPKAGSIAIKDLSVRYLSRPNHTVISGLSAEIRSGEKVAIVGRTGSGKSTLMASLFRIVEASGGSISIDGVDVAKLGLHTLRSRLQIIPQEPILFDGTVRSNIDMRGKHTDDALWAALETVGLKEYVNGMQGKLDATVTEGGSNLSAGQRQLLCLCRAVLSKPKVLVIDEATASVDADADRRIQLAVTNEFRDTTVLSIAHRLNTIAAFDRVVVLDSGHLVEFDAPHRLLQLPDSRFSKFVDATGQANAAVIREIAAAHHASTAVISE